MTCANRNVQSWVEEVTALVTPKEVVWVNGSDAENSQLCDRLVADGTFVRLNEKLFPNSYWSRSHPNDVARVEGRTYICSATESDAGPTNNWADPKEMKQKLSSLMKGCMAGRTMYVVPYLMGPDGSPYSRVGFELTDSAYVVANMRIMARIGDVALKNLADDANDFVRGVHSIGTLDDKERYICHFPDTMEVLSFNTNYGGNALQGKKCFALRLASCKARKEGWLAEHMLILGITRPDKKKFYVCAAFPSACGKTNLAMLVPPKNYLDAGWKVETVGDDIAWLNFGSDGRLWAINPEAGFFGVAPGTSEKTNPNALAAVHGNTIFTNTALDLDTMTPWWEGLTAEKPANLRDWLGNDYDHDSETKAAHPNSRFTAPAKQCPCISSEFENPHGVPISAIIFGGRRARTAPLVYESLSWEHGTFVGLTMASETTAAAVGAVGKLKRDPMAMRPFIGYHVADYIEHWLDMGKKGGSKMPGVFHVNWFRTNDDGKFIWPGFGDNIRVLEWILKRIEGEVDGEKTPLGLQPGVSDLDTTGLQIDQKALASLLSVDREDWEQEITSSSDFLQSLGSTLPKQMWNEHANLKNRFGL
ncbi:MAG: phosphoenolpyruvate carboxykinase (GTP) [Bdellovibrionales bacterium]|nr:phosphoenolpyruvate carboxykinase (GTP) [Bdellovibrionales bacterium]